ncbi:MAG TPA: hypothetical protein VF278_19510 [Pirellulales bacterium]
MESQLVIVLKPGILRRPGRASWAAVLLALVFGFAATVKAVEPEAGISLIVGNGGSPVFELRGLRGQEAAAANDAADALFAVYTIAETASANRPALAGEYTKLPDGLRFTPRFPLEPGMRYRAVYKGAGGTLEKQFAVAPRADTPPARVRAIYPSAKILPQNQLKFYVHFTAPMSRGDAYRHFALLDASGAAVDLPFLELSEELWNPAGDRLTLLLDPARVKRDLKPRNESGPVLEIGKRYSLVVGRDFRDAQGRPLNAEFRKDFAVAAPDETCPRPAAWRLSAPTAGTRQPLVVRFGEPLDHALLARWIWVEDAAGQEVLGNGSSGDEESSWNFLPKEPWPPGQYKLKTDKRLEDLAGNSIARKFELDGRRAMPAGDENGAATVEFAVDGLSRRQN